MQDDTVLFSLVDGIARITLNRPDKLNALTVEMLERLPDLIAASPRQGARVILLTGAGRGFCSGAALGSLEPGVRDLGDMIATYYNPVARAFADSAIPIVTAVNGAAAGAGAALALAGDIIVAGRSAFFQFAFANIGLVPDAGSTWLMAKAVGRVKALELALLAERLSADDALAAGLVTRTVADDRLDDAAAALAARLAAMPTMALGLIRRQIRAALDGGFETSLNVEMENQRVAGFSQDHIEGVAAFVEKREPRFDGR